MQHGSQLLQNTKIALYFCKTPVLDCATSSWNRFHSYCKDIFVSKTCPESAYQLLLPPRDSAMWRQDFLLGAATAAYQIEGAIDEDGRLPSIWDRYCETPGMVANGDSGAHACDHYHRWPEDVALLAELGFDAYRLSLAWPRVMDEKGGRNDKGLDFYKRLLDALRERGLRTYVTLYHWDLPQYLQDRGGWTNRDVAYRYADYVDLVSRELSGRVSSWMTLNEPWCSAYLGHASGRQAPGLQDLRYARQAMHHLLLGHGHAVPLLRANDPQAQVGLVANVGYGTPASDTPQDRDAAYLFQMQHNAWVLDPLLRASYPADLDRLWPDSAPLVLDGDLTTIAAPLDFLGINYYFRSNLAADAAEGFRDVPVDGVERTQMGWEVHPDGLRRLLLEFKASYPNLPPIYITENGMASDDRVSAGEVADTQRIGFIGGHLRAVDQAMRAGVDVRGYFVWSLLDNFEWSYGYAPRFGIVHVDYATQQRTPKHSALAIQRWLAERRREHATP